MSRRGAAARAGFTLIEVLVGITVAALALTAGIAALGFASDRARHAEEAMIAALEGAAARDLIVDWLSAAVPRLPAGTPLDGAAVPAATGLATPPFSVGAMVQFWGVAGEQGGAPADELYVPTRAPTPLERPQAMVRLYIDRDPSTPERGLTAEFTAGFGVEPHRTELVPGATGLRIRYLPFLEGSPVAVEWLPEWPGQDALPRAVELTVFASSLDALPPLLQRPIRVVLGGLE